MSGVVITEKVHRTEKTYTQECLCLDHLKHCRTALKELRHRTLINPDFQTIFRTAPITLPVMTNGLAGSIPTKEGLSGCSDSTPESATSTLNVNT